MEERFFIEGIKVWKKSSFQPTEKSPFISKKKLWKAVLYYSNFVKKITECNQKVRTFFFSIEFRFEIAIRPHIFADSYSSTHFSNL